MWDSITSSIGIGPEKPCGAFRIPQEFPESLPQWVITRIRPRLSPLVAPSLTWLPHVPTRGWLTLDSPPACARERDDPIFSRCLSHSRTAPLRHVYAAHTPSPLFSTGSRPTLTAYPRKRSQLGYSEPRDGVDTVRKVTVYGSYACALARVWPLHRDLLHTASACRLHEQRTRLDRYRLGL